MPGLGGLTQWLLWVAESETQQAGATQSGAAAEIGGVTPKCPALGLDILHHLLKPEFGCSRKRVHRQMRFAEIVSVKRRAYKAITNSRRSCLPTPIS